MDLGLPDIAKHCPVIAETKYFMGVDVGALQDPSAISIIEWRRRGTGEWSIDGSKVSTENAVDSMVLKHIERIPLTTIYVDVASHVIGITQREPLAGNVTITVDRNGVGQGLVDLLRRHGVRPHTIFSTGGDNPRREGQDYKVPQSALINNLIAKIDTGELRVAAGVPDRAALEGELMAMRRHISDLGRIRYSAESGKHDDMIFSWALAVWTACHQPRGARALRLAGW